MNKILSFIAIFIVCLLVWLGVKGHQFFHTPLVKIGVTRTVRVYPNERVNELAARLSKEKIIHNPRLFVWFVDITGHRDHLRYGEYLISGNLTLWQLLQNMAAGRGLYQHRLTIVDGWRFGDIRLTLQAHDALKKTINDHPADDRAIMKMISGRDENPEGWFYPDTYFFVWGNEDQSILKTAYQKMQTVLANAWRDRAPGLPYQTPYQALIAASLIERETGLSEEKPIISSVILNRMEKGMRLQIDPTVQYGLGKSFGSEITKKELETKTAYNTYFIHGLPPTPICMPSRSSIEAALHPAKTNYLYYVATGNGGHRFSSTYLQHQKGVEKYRWHQKVKQQEMKQVKAYLQRGGMLAAQTVITMLYWPLFSFAPAIG